MPIAAVPAYMPQADFSKASPALRFGLLLSIWTARGDQVEEVTKRAEANSREGEQLQAELGPHKENMDQVIGRLLREERGRRLPRLWEKNDFAAQRAWKGIEALSPSDRECIKGLIGRMSAISRTLPQSWLWSCNAEAISPFTTGLGNEHPLENGFSFLNPYGLPYLAGSGVKGVVREAARQLAEGQWAESHGWHKEHVGAFTASSEGEKTTIPLTALDVLFGRETPSGESDHFRGVLSFWDVIPEIKGDKLRVEVMTPHQSHYYQQKREPRTGNSTTPHDSGQPNPILFLTVPPGSRFTFHVVCDEVRLRKVARELAEGEKWKRLLEAAFEHAFTWLGFGAKTAVGYGAMKRSESRPAPAPQVGRDRDQQQRAPAPASNETVWEKATLRWDPSKKELTATLGSQKTAPLRDKRAEDLINKLPENEREILKNRKSVPNRPVKVRAEGNKVEIVDLA